MRDVRTVHCIALNLVPAVISVYFILKSLFWICDFADLVFLVDEVTIPDD